MRRREIITSIVSAAGWPFVARAQQQAKVWTVGVLVRASPGSQRFWELFPGLMRERGYVEGQNVRYEFRSDEGDITRLPGLAADLVKLKVDVIVPWFTPAAIAAKQATHDIPIVCAVCGDMVGTDLVSSLARPGGNVTGINGMAAELSGKLVEWIREAMPTARRVAVLVNAPDSFSKPFLKQVQLAGEATGTAIEPIMIQRPEELEAAFAAMEQRRPDAIVVQPSLPTKQVAQLALIHRLPSACAIAPFTGDGGLMAYWGVEVDGYRRAASLVDRVLKGAKPAELPVEQPTKLVLTINLRTAKAIGLTIPQALLQRADEVVE
jgi:putative tryptophan/tyrosine transport system substrate-binding protein